MIITTALLAAADFAASAPNPTNTDPGQGGGTVTWILVGAVIVLVVAIVAFNISRKRRG